MNRKKRAIANRRFPRRSAKQRYFEKIRYGRSVRTMKILLDEIQRLTALIANATQVLSEAVSSKSSADEQGRKQRPMELDKKRTTLGEAIIRSERRSGRLL
jgi:hypothetical protein